MKIKQIIDRTKTEYEYSDPHGSATTTLAALNLLAEIERWLSEGATLKATNADGFGFEILEDGSVRSEMTITGAKAGVILYRQNVPDEPRGK